MSYGQGRADGVRPGSARRDVYRVHTSRNSKGSRGMTTDVFPQVRGHLPWSAACQKGVQLPPRAPAPTCRYAGRGRFISTRINTTRVEWSMKVPRTRCHGPGLGRPQGVDVSNPSRPIPPEQARVMHLALCERLGIDPAIVGEDTHWEVTGGEELGRVQLTAYLPADELIAMFNKAGRSQGPEKMTEAEAEDYLRGYCTFGERERCSMAEVYEIAKMRGDREHMAVRVREAGEILGLA